VKSLLNSRREREASSTQKTMDGSKENKGYDGSLKEGVKNPFAMQTRERLARKGMLRNREEKRDDNSKELITTKQERRIKGIVSRARKNNGKRDQNQEILERHRRKTQAKP